MNMTKIFSVEEFAKEIASVQPMGGHLFSDVLSEAKYESELRELGYRPVSSSNSILWVKD